MTRIRVIVFSLLFAAGTIHFFTLDSGSGFIGPRVDGDGVYYWHYLRSLFIDHDVDFTNDYALYGNPWNYGTSHLTGRPGNPASIGPALLWAPVYAVAHGLVLLSASRGHVVRTDGWARPEELATLYSSFLAAFGALLLVFCLLRRHLDELSSLLGTFGIALGTGLFFYTQFQPSYSHAHCALVMAAFVERWDATRDRRTLAGWTLLGTLGGFAMLVRPQLAVAAILPASDLARALHAAWRHPALRRDLARTLLGAGLGAGAAILAFAPQMAAWSSIYGSSLAIPQGRSFMRWDEPLILETLFHPRAGLVPWTPIAGAAILGLLVVSRRRPSLGLPLVLLFAATTYVNAASWDWWSGYTYGARRFTGMLPVFALGLGFLVDAAIAWMRARPGRTAAAVAGVVVAAFCLLNLQMMQTRRREDLDWYRQSRFYKIYLDAVSKLAGKVVETVGDPGAFPANLLFAIRYGRPPALYDEVAGHYFLDEKHGIVHNGWWKQNEEDLDLAGEIMRPFLSTDFGAPLLVDGRRAVPVASSRASVLLPLVQKPNLRAVISVRSEEVGTRLAISFNGTPVGTRPLAPRWQDVAVAIPSRLVARGLNELVLEQSPPPAAPRPVARAIGRTGALSPVDLAVLSQGKATGDHAELWVDGRRVGSEQRGLNLVALDPKTGSVLETAAYDLCFWQHGGAVLHRQVLSLSPGTIVLLAVRDDSSREFSPPARLAFEALGLGTDLRGRFRASFAAIGVRGAPVGSALERLVGAGDATLVVGRPPEPWRRRISYWRLRLEVTREMIFD
jgi:hypothetical protein